MKRLIMVLLILAVPIFGAYVATRVLPYYVYDQVIHGKLSHTLYKLNRFEDRFLKPGAMRKAGESSTDFSGLWKEFHLRDVVVPLPTGHPMFRTIPIIQLIPGSAEPQIGVDIKGPSGRQIAKIFLLKSGAWSDQFESQELFKLPLVKKVLKAKTSEQIWKDLFSRQIVGWDLPFEDMVYNLYILQLRSALLPRGFDDFGILENDGMAFIEIPSKDKDYRTEIIFSFDRGLLLSYLIVTERNNADSEDLRSRMIKGIQFRSSDPSLASIIYKEFKQLSFIRQTDQEGMLYLLSAWSHNMEDVEMLKEMIYFLERGPKNGPQLKPLYKYVYSRYQKTFTTRDIGLDEDEPEIRLQRQIELEAITERKQLLEKPKVAPKVEEVSPAEKMNEFLRKAREDKLKKTKSRDKLIIH
ncbi:MAG: hypothetical protein K2P81_01185 [Bacteriovoracaceae bacterium]|nr:hypothetical protein [Bacteriovoracaceae bacterium]